MDDSDGGTAVRQRRRAAVLRALAAEGASGAEAAPALDEAIRVFGGERELLRAVHQRWQVTLLARLDQVLEVGAGELHDEVVGAVAGLSRDLPGFAALLRRPADDPVLAAARRRLAGYVGRACGCGRPHPLVAPARPTVRVAGDVRRWLVGLLAAAPRRLGRCPLTRGQAVPSQG